MYNDPPDRYPKWYMVTIECHRKGRKPTTKKIWAKWLPIEKRWVAGNRKTVKVLDYEANCVENKQ